MAELNSIMKLPIKYEYKIENNGVILNRDALNLIDKVSASVYQTYLDQELSESDKFFVAYVVKGDVLDNDWAECSFRILELGDVQLQILIQKMVLAPSDELKH